MRLPWEISDETTQELVYRFRDELRDWSRSFPELAFAYVRAECFGGHCEYEGYVCRNGAILFEEELDSKALGRLMALIGVKLPAGDYFEPFTRKYEW